MTTPPHDEQPRRRASDWAEVNDDGLPSISVVAGPLWMKAAYIFGVPAIIAGALVWVLAVRVDSGVSAIREAQGRQELAQSQLGKDMEGFQTKLERMEHLLEQICANGATNFQDRTSCFR